MSDYKLMPIAEYDSDRGLAAAIDEEGIKQAILAWSTITESGDGESIEDVERALTTADGEPYLLGAVELIFSELGPGRIEAASSFIKGLRTYTRSREWPILSILLRMLEKSRWDNEQSLAAWDGVILGIMERCPEWKHLSMDYDSEGNEICSLKYMPISIASRLGLYRTTFELISEVHNEEVYHWTSCTADDIQVMALRIAKVLMDIPSFDADVHVMKTEGLDYLINTWFTFSEARGWIMSPHWSIPVEVNCRYELRRMALSSINLGWDVFQWLQEVTSRKHGDSTANKFFLESSSLTAATILIEQSHPLSCISNSTILAQAVIHLATQYVPIKCFLVRHLRCNLWKADSAPRRSTLLHNIDAPKMKMKNLERTVLFFIISTLNWEGRLSKKLQGELRAALNVLMPRVLNAFFMSPDRDAHLVPRTRASPVASFIETVFVGAGTQCLGQFVEAVFPHITGEMFKQLGDSTRLAIKTSVASYFKEKERKEGSPESCGVVPYYWMHSSTL